MTDLIDRQAAIEEIISQEAVYADDAIYILKSLPAQPDADLIHLQKEQAYMQGWEDSKASIIRCKECKHFHYDMPYVIQGVPVLGHEVCDAWGDGCKTDENGYCFLAERSTDEHSG